MEQRGHGLPEDQRFLGWVGASPAVQRVNELVSRVSQRNFPVVILGESGTGKELVARLIHNSGPRCRQPFVPLDCSAVTPTLVESELFGHVKGAFTDATHAKLGLFEAANNGTLFLDEIGDFPTNLQVKLLRAMQEKEIRPLGSTQRTPINVRVIAATNRDLEEAVRNGTFRQDLYFRLNVVQIQLPPLRQRKDDIPLLVGFFLEKFRDPAQSAHTVSSAALLSMMAYDWPGNVRELENAIQRAMALSTNAVLQAGDLLPECEYREVDSVLGDDELVPMKEIERRAVFRALQETGGDKIAAARLLGVGKTTLYRKLHRYAHEPTIAAHI